MCSDGDEGARAPIIQRDGLGKVLATDYGKELEEAETIEKAVKKRLALVEKSGADLTIRTQLHIEKWRAKREFNTQLSLKDTTDRLVAALKKHGAKLVGASDASTRAAKSIGRYTLVLCLVTGVLGLAAIAQLAVAIIGLCRSW